jgi:hypothetical protein
MAEGMPSPQPRPQSAPPRGPRACTQYEPAPLTDGSRPIPPIADHSMPRTRWRISARSGTVITPGQRSLHPGQSPSSHLIFFFVGNGVRPLARGMCFPARSSSSCQLSGSPANASAKPASATGEATTVPDSLVTCTVKPPLLFRLVRNSGVASTCAAQTVGWQGSKSKLNVNLSNAASSFFSIFSSFWIFSHKPFGTMVSRIEAKGVMPDRTQTLKRCFCGRSIIIWSRDARSTAPGSTVLRLRSIWLW